MIQRRVLRAAGEVRCWGEFVGGHSPPGSLGGGEVGVQESRGLSGVVLGQPGPWCSLLVG